MAILIADDDPAVRVTLEETLTAAGYRAFAVADGAAAVRACRTIAPDAIVLDVAMPVLNGWQAATAIRALGCDAPIIFLSDDAAAAQTQEHVRVAAAAELSKPLAAAALLAELRRLVRRPVPAGRADRLATVIA